MIAAFLSKFRPGGPWTLAAVVPDGKIGVLTFTDPAQAEAWARIENKTKNMYLCVNPTLKPINKKATKEQIAALEFLHVDVDPRAGEDFDNERSRILASLTTKLPNGIPPPTCIVDSGGGFNAYWRLAEPISINGDVRKAAEAERWNIALEKLFGADACHNCDRILRLPGTTNWPNKTKRAKGRTATAAEVYSWSDADGGYPLSAFALKLPPGKTPVAFGVSSTDKSTPTAAVGSHTGPDELQAWARENGKVIPDLPLAVLVHGRDFDPAKYPSRSEALWAVLCGLARAGVPNELIVAAVKDPSNKASACVLDKRNPDREAWGQLSKALATVEREAAEGVDPVLAEMNAEHSVMTAGRVRVLSWRKTHPKIDRLAPDLQSFEDFRNRFRHQRVAVGTDKQGNTVYKKKGDWWLDHALRREILGICFVPGDPPEVDGFQNLWRGWGVEPRAGDWTLMRSHVHQVLAQGNDEYSSYILRWAAWAVQNPEKQAEAALVFRGRQGTGKGFFGRTLKDLFGQHGLHIKSAKHLTGDFNLHLRDCCLLFADEAIAPGDKGAESRLKGLITEPDLTIEGKGENLVTEPNHLHVVMASNEEWVVPAQADERRYAVFDVSNEHRQDGRYFEAMAKQLDNGGRAAMLHDLLAMPLGDWHPRSNIPQTAALAKQKAEGLSGFEAFAFDLLITDQWPIDRLISGSRFVTSKELLELSQQWLRGRAGVNHVTFNKIEAVMGRLLGCTKHRMSGSFNGYLLPGIGEMRQRWTAARFPWPWDATEIAVIQDDGDRPPF